MRVVSMVLVVVLISGSTVAQSLSYSPDVICVGGQSVFTAPVPAGHMLCLMTGTGGANGSVTYPGIAGVFRLESPYSVVGEYTTTQTMTINIPASATGSYCHAQAVLLNIATGALSFTNAVTLTSVSVEFSEPGGGALPSPYRLGISAMGNDRTKAMQAEVSPAAEAANVTIESDDGVLVINENYTLGTIDFELVGQTPSESMAGEEVRVEHASAGACGSTNVRVVVPESIATPHPTFSGPVDGVNVLLHAGTVPPIPGVPAGTAILGTTYSTPLTIQLLDQFEDPLGDVYDGARVEERTEGSSSWTYINVNVDANGSYVDNVGRISAVGDPPILYPLSSDEAMNWTGRTVLEPILTPAGRPVVHNIGVRIDGFKLDPGIANRQVSLAHLDDDSAILTITWPHN